MPHLELYMHNKVPKYIFLNTHLHVFKSNTNEIQLQREKEGGLQKDTKERSCKTISQEKSQKVCYKSESSQVPTSNKINMATTTRSEANSFL